MFSELFQTFLRCWRPLVVADIVFKLAATIVIAPIVALAFRAFVEASGRTVLADEDILNFVASPIGALCLLCVGGLVLATVVLEQAVLLRILWTDAAGRRPHVISAISGAASDTWTTVKLGALLVASAVVLALPYVVALGLVYWWLLTGHDINFYLAEKPTAFWVAVALGGVIAVAAAVMLCWWFAARVMSIPLLVVRRLGVRESIAESRKLTTGKQWQIGRWLLGWLAVVVLAPAALFAIYLAVGNWLAGQFESLAALAVVVGVLTMVHLALSFVVHLITVIGFALIVWKLWRHLDESSTEVIGETPPEEESTNAAWLVWNRWRFGAVAIVAIGIAGLIGAASLAGLKLTDDVQIIAHRGGGAHGPENSLAAIRQAILDRTQWVEIDVQETSDDRLAVVHDRDLKRLAGSALEVHSSTLEQLEQLDIGNRFSPDFKGEQVTTLDAVLELCQGRVGVVIELKQYGFDKQLEQRVVDLVEQYDLADDVMIISLDSKMIAKIRQLRPQWRVGLLTAVKLGDLTRVDANLLAVRKDLATPSFIARAHFRDREVAAWTLNSRESLERMISRGVDYVITDDVPLAEQVLLERRELSLPERWLRALAASW
ncbi:glycerophosphoryl diester phosphodiesterase membrane domain-containing protein [Aeoliella sp. ICT_H6.2]|uniref:Glycerophosphoryl diester phosphodiesterase membrane domain-containing protein n=1 Tax=Aeoliella straminimaris TaxID=2954799 RepID=A0A9X2FET5_9BACT|nr:glycerophosphodiester phosphodiesterase family protein [Aeoliella straminimaris]MCO6047837.1 glycerophosphoryl diester phosphodiesterase membrane domain-containing protein [Aeoliella straminimaris]